MKNKANVISAVLAIILLLMTAPFVFAQQQRQAVIREMAGTVEIKQANAEVWEAAGRGQTLAWDTVISTGFRSTAVIALGDSLVTLRPLTRISILELSQSQGSEKVELNLQTGRVRGNVKAPQGGQTEFVIRSPNSTSSVRGTIFEFDTLSLAVLEGTVEFKGIMGVSGITVDSGVSVDSIDSAAMRVTRISGITGSPHLVDAGGFIKVDEYTGRVSHPTEGVLSGLRPEDPMASEPINVLAPDPSPDSPPSEPSTPSEPSPRPPSDPSPKPPSDRPQPDKPQPDRPPTPVDFTPIIKF